MIRPESIDLHIHSTFSDGTECPAQIVREAARLGLAAIAITDHDNAGGYAEAKAEGERCGVEVIPGIEISTRYGTSVHILGYCIDPDADAARSLLKWIIEDRDRRNREICRIMAEDGIPVSYDSMKERFGPVIGRPHFASVLMEAGLAVSINDAFARYVEKGRKYYVSRNIIPIDRAIRLILDAGGIPVLAHPFQYRKSDSELREMIAVCRQYGLKGMECRYSLYNAEQEAYLEKMAEEYHLLKTGGSDFHGTRKPHIHLGTGTEETPLHVPYEWLTLLKKYAGECQK